MMMIMMMMMMMDISGHYHMQEYKPKGLELVGKANGTHIFQFEIAFGNFILPFN